jgi:hypothetical protein
LRQFFLTGFAIGKKKVTFFRVFSRKALVKSSIVPGGNGTIRSLSTIFPAIFVIFGSGSLRFVAD